MLQVECPRNIVLDSYPGPLFQVLSHLVSNSLTHAFDDTSHGVMKISVQVENDKLGILYSDNGSGIEPQVREKAFEPFFTTKLGSGGSGLGLHLTYNFVTQILGGSIKIHRFTAEGFACTIIVPLVAPVKSN